MCIKSSSNSLWWHFFAILILWHGTEDSFLMTILCGWTLFILSQSGELEAPILNWKKKVVNQRYLTLANTDVLSSSDSFFEDQKVINFIFDIVIGYSHAITHVFHIMGFMICFNAPDFYPRSKMFKEFLK